MHDRTMRLRRRGLNPTKIIFVYCLALALVCIHQAGRVADWFEDLALSREGTISEVSFKVASFFRDRVDPWGPSQLNRAENWVLALFAPGSAPRPVLWDPPPSGPDLTPSNPGRPDQPPPDTPRPGPDEQPAGMPPIHWALDARPILPTPPSSEPDGQQMASLPPQGHPADQARGFNPARVLLLGDSMMLEGLGPPLQRELKKNEGLAVFRDGRYGTGLVRLDNFDWLAYFDQMLEKYYPDLIILTLGANDTQDMVEEGRRLPVGGQEWTELYARRVADLLNRAQARRARVFWVGLPIMGREPYGTRTNHINQVVEAVCRVAANCRYWDSRLSVADAKGQYATYLSDEQGRSQRIRKQDLIHLTEVGGRIMADKFLAETASWADYIQNTALGDVSGLESSNALQPLAPSAGEGDDEGEPVGRLTRHQFFSKLRGKETAYMVAAPKLTHRLTRHRFFDERQGREVNYTTVEPGPAKKFRRPPLVLLLHGAWDGYGVWAERLGAETLTRLAAERGLILVMPDGEPFGWYLDGRETAIESYLMTELLPQVLADYPEADSNLMGVLGLSMGGHGALTLALKYPQAFKAVGSMSGITDLSAHAGQRHKVDPELKIDRVLGPPGTDGQNWRPYGAQGLTEQSPKKLAGRPLILSVGMGDRLTLAENRAYHELLTRLKVDHVYRESPGGHDWDYWAAQLPVQLDFMADKLKSKFLLDDLK